MRRATPSPFVSLDVKAMLALSGYVELFFYRVLCLLPYSYSPRSATALVSVLCATQHHLSRCMVRTSVSFDRDHSADVVIFLRGLVSLTFYVVHIVMKVRSHILLRSNLIFSLPPIASPSPQSIARTRVEILRFWPRGEGRLVVKVNNSSGWAGHALPAMYVGSSSCFHILIIFSPRSIASPPRSYCTPTP